MPKSHLDKITLGVAGNFLELTTCHFTDEHGRPRDWEAVRRINSTGAVMILAETSSLPKSILIIRQFRPPTGKYVLEFPAGLIDPGETPSEAAERELYEETGFLGKIEEVLPHGFSSPGMSDEQIITVRMSIDHAPNAPLPTPHQEDSENIEVFLVPVSQAKDFICQQLSKGDGVDAKLLLAFYT